MAFSSALLVTCLLYCQLCYCEGAEKDDVFTHLRPAPIPEVPLKCGMYLKYPDTGFQTTHSVPDYLDSKGLRCSEAISSQLKEIFSPGEENATTIREDLQEKLGGVCSAFVDIISTILFNNAQLSGGICQDHLFADPSLEVDFCERIKSMDGEEETALASNLEAFEGRWRWAKIAADGVTTLQSLDEKSCPEKCGSGYSKLLCNAYYSIALLFSQEFPKVLEARAKGKVMENPRPL